MATAVVRINITVEMKQQSSVPAHELEVNLRFLQFTMEIEVEGKLSLLGAELIRKDDRLETKVYIKPTNTGLLLHFDSNVDTNCCCHHVESRIPVIIYVEVFHR